MNNALEHTINHKSMPKNKKQKSKTDDIFGVTLNLERSETRITNKWLQL